jgi:hypothetical protein
MVHRGKEFGRDLADRMAFRMRLQRVTVEQVTLNVATEVAKRANEMLAAGRARDEVAAWVEQVQKGYVERLGQESTKAARPSPVEATMPINAA